MSLRPDNLPAFIMPASHPLRVARRAEMDKAAWRRTRKIALMMAFSVFCGWLLSLLLVR